METLRVTTRGVGRKDYSENVEVATAPFIRRGTPSWQQRFFYSVRYTALDGLTFPDVYEVLLSFLVDNALQFTAPSRPYLFYLVSISSDRNALVGMALNRYASLADYQAGNITEHAGQAYGYGKASLQYKKGIPTVEGNVYTVYIGDWLGTPFNLNLVIHGLIGGVEEVE